MTTFVRAIAVDEGSVFGRLPSASAHDVAVLDRARTEGMRVILVSGRSLEELAGPAPELLSHFDAVVAQSGAVVRVRAGQAQRLARPSRRAAVLSVLEQLDVDPHDALGVSGSGGSDLGELLEVSVTVREPGAVDEAGAGSADESAAGSADGPEAGRGDFRLPTAGALDRLLDDLRSGWPHGSPARHDVRVRATGRPEVRGELVVPGGHANLLLCAARDPGLPERVAAGWGEAGYQTLLIRLAPPGPAAAIGSGGPAGLAVVDARAPFWRQELADQLDGDPRVTVLDLSGLAAPGIGDSGGSRDRRLGTALAAALADVRSRRASTGRPHWLVLDPAERALSDPDLPPEALDLRESGHCLVLRSHREALARPAFAVGEVRPCSPGCPLTTTGAPAPPP